MKFLQSTPVKAVMSLISASIIAACVTDYIKVTSERELTIEQTWLMAFVFGALAWLGLLALSAGALGRVYRRARRAYLRERWRRERY